MRHPVQFRGEGGEEVVIGTEAGFEPELLDAEGLLGPVGFGVEASDEAVFPEDGEGVVSETPPRGRGVAFDAVVESDDTNNTSTTNLAPLTVGAATGGLPDLQFPSGDFSYSPSSPDAATPITIQATIKNDSTQHSGPSFVAVRFYDVTTGLLIGDYDRLPSLGPDESVVVERTVTLAAGPHDIVIDVDFPQFIVEFNEANNYVQQVITVLDSPTMPDVVVTMNDISFSNDHPGFGERIDIEAVVRNTGNADAHNVSVEFHQELILGDMTRIGPRLRDFWLPLTVTLVTFKYSFQMCRQRAAMLDSMDIPHRKMEAFWPGSI